MRVPRRQAAGGCRGTNRDRPIGDGHMRRVRVDVRVDGDGLYAKFLTGAGDPDGDLSTVRNKDFPEHTPYSPDG